MAATTRTEFLEQLKKRSKILAALDADILEAYLDSALFAYSEKLPRVRTQKNITVVTTNLYNLPTDALKMLKVFDFDTHTQLSFRTEEDDSTSIPKIILGKKQLGSAEEEGLLSQGYYIDIINHNITQPSLDAITGITAVDFEYTALQTVATISKTGHEALKSYVEGLAFEDKAAGDAERLVDVVDAEPSGASTTIRLSQAQKVYQTMAMTKMQRFDDLTRVAYGVRE